MSKHVGIESLQIGWNMASLPDIECYKELLNGIGSNCCNLREIELYADSEYKLEVLGILLRKNTILRDIKLNIMDWNGIEDESGNGIGSTDNDLMKMCDKLIKVMIDNQVYLEQQMNGIKKNLCDICRFPNGLCLNMLEYIYPNENYSLNLEVVMNCADDNTPKVITDNFKDKMRKMNDKLDVDFVKRNLKFKISKPWPG